jgi:perosamine synthetase
VKKIPVTQPLFSGNEITYATNCITSTWLSAGKYVEEFEKKFAQFCNTSFALTSSSGTTALHLTLLGLGVTNGDEIIVPDLSYVSSTNAVYYIGATPVFIDVDLETWTIDPNKIEEKITKKTKAIIVVHLYGHPADMDKINAIAKKYKLIVIEDACEAHGALYKKEKVGSLSKIGCFSFSGAKTITTGEGGMIVSNDAHLMQKIQGIKSNFTNNKRHFYHSAIGYPYRYTNIQAAIGLAQLEKLNDLINIKIKNAEIYNNLLREVDIIQLPPQKSWAKNVFWLYSIVLKKPGLRDKLMNYLGESGIQTRPFFVPMHKLPMYKHSGKYPVTAYLAENGMNLPSGLTLDKKDIEYVTSRVKTFLKTHA